MLHEVNKISGMCFHRMKNLTFLQLESDAQDDRIN